MRQLWVCSVFLENTSEEMRRDREEKKRYLLRKLSFRPSVEELKNRKVKQYLIGSLYLWNFPPLLFVCKKGTIHMFYRFRSTFAFVIGSTISSSKIISYTQNRVYSIYIYNM